MYNFRRSRYRMFFMEATFANILGANVTTKDLVFYKYFQGKLLLIGMAT